MVCLGMKRGAMDVIMLLFLQGGRVSRNSLSWEESNFAS